MSKAMFQQKSESKSVPVMTESEVKKKVTLSTRLTGLFTALERAGVSYCVLRGEEELYQLTGYLEIDLLVHPDDLSRFSSTVSGLGFAELPSWGHAPHQFFVSYEVARGDWLKLDVVTDLRYGAPIRRFGVDLMEACIATRVSKNGVYGLSSQYEFITLLLHCLLDKGRFKLVHTRRLKKLWAELSEDPELMAELRALVSGYLSPAITWQEIEVAFSNSDCKALLARRRSLQSQYFKKQPLISTWRALSSQVLRRLRPFLFGFHGHGFAVALLAPDGGGKSTLARSLSADRMLKARQVYMGGNLAARNVGLPTTRWLHEAVKSRNGKAERSPVTQLLKAVNFVNKLLEQWLRTFVVNIHLWRGRVVILDRYVYDSWVNRKKITILKRVRRMLFEACLPEPRLVLFLDAPGEVLFRRKGEHTPDWLEQQWQSYLKLSDRIPNMKIIDASKDAESVRHEAIKLILAHRGTN